MIALMVLAGGLGAVARFVVDAELRARWGSAFPWATLVINVLGSLLLGVLAALVTHGTSPEVKLVLGTGFCGGFTTFSTACVEAVRLVQQGRPVAALCYLLATMVLCCAVAAVAFVAL